MGEITQVNEWNCWWLHLVEHKRYYLTASEYLNICFCRIRFRIWHLYTNV